MTRTLTTVFKAFRFPFNLMLRLLTLPARWAKPAKTDEPVWVPPADDPHQLWRAIEERRASGEPRRHLWQTIEQRRAQQAEAATGEPEADTRPEQVPPSLHVSVGEAGMSDSHLGQTIRGRRIKRVLQVASASRGAVQAERAQRSRSRLSARLAGTSGRVLIPVAAIVALAVAAASYAYFTATGSGHGTASVATLTAPNPSAATPTEGQAHIAWTAVKLSPDNPSLDGQVTYAVQRSSNGGATWGATNSSCAGTLPSTTLFCNDSPSPGLYEYKVTATFNSWTSVGTTGTVTVAAAPTITSTSPSSGDRGATNEIVTIVGTGFVNGGSLAASFGANITVNSTTFVDSSHVTANITISGSATTGARNVTLTNGDGSSATGTNVFTVNAAPTVTSTSPSSLDQGATGQNVSIVGTGFDSGASLAASFSGTGITVNSTTFVDSSHVTANITISGSATTGARNVTLTNGDGSSATGTGVFTVNAGPTVTSTSPSSRDQGATGQNVSIIGTGFLSGASLAASFGLNITVNSTTFVDSSHVTANITISGSATTGARNVTLTNGDGSSATGTNVFTVNAAPTVTSTSPSSLDQGATGQNVSIIGIDFLSGASLAASFGPNITVNSTTFVDSSHVTANITISGSATTGARNVTLTNGDGSSATGTNVFTVNAAPTVTSTSPSSLDQGATGQNVSIVGTGFDSGASLAASFSGTGITVNSTTFVDSSHVTANITISGSATTGARNVTLTNGDGSSATGTGVFTVNAGPTITSTSPNAGDRGATNEAVTIIGTGFDNGSPLAASFGSNITVNSTTFVDSSHVTANITIAAGAATGARNVTLTNGDGSNVTGTGVFTVNAVPTVTSTSPSSLDQGATTQNVTIVGTGFDGGLSLLASFGANITVNSTTFVDSSHVTANITISGSATTGARNVTLTNGDGSSATGTNVFTVNLAPTITSTSPSTGDQGATNELVTITGTGFIDTLGTTLASSFGSGVTVNSTTFVSATSLTANITISALATTGVRTVTVTNGDGSTATWANVFTVNAAPTVTSTSPSTGDQGATDELVTITGTGFINSAGTTLASSFGSGVTVNSTTFNSATSLTANITILGTATTGARTVTVTNGDGTTATGTNVFTVNAAPTITSTSPSSLDQGATNQNVSVVGTGFDSGLSLLASFGANITVNSTTFVDSSHVTANITIASGATTGARNVTLTNGDGSSATGTGVFTVNAAPTVTSTSPSSGDRGATNEAVTIIGTGFLSGPSLAASFGANITVNSTTFVDSSHVTANITIAAGATTGARNVTLTNGDGSSATGTNVFTVNAAPTVTSTSPSSLDQGATSQNVTIVGTGFDSGLSLLASFGANITVNSTTFVDSSHVTANITIASGATTGARNVTLTNGDGSSATGTNVFTVNAAPTITSTSPSSGDQGATNELVTITGTGFINTLGTTLASSFGSGVTVNSTTFVSATSLTANITISGSATTGARTVTVTNGDGSSASLASAFTVSAAPTITSTSPSSRGQGATSQNVSIVGTGFDSGAALAASFGSNITVNSTTFVDSSHVTANITISGSATTGARNVTLTNGDGSSATGANVFTVNAAPTVTSTSPSSRGQGATSQVISVVGTGFVTGAVASFSNAGITVNSTSFVDSSHLNVNITISGSAATGAGNVTVTNPDAGVGTGTNVFTVNAAPTVTSTSPSSRGQGATSQVISVVGTGFVTGAVASFSNAGITVNSTSFVDSSHLNVNITISGSAATGAGNVTVTNPDAGVGTGTNVFTVNARPTVTSTSPSSRGQGATSQVISVIGTGFVTGAVASFSNAGITVNSTSFVDSSHLNVNITISGSAATGAGNVTVTNPDAGVGTGTNVFTVNAAPTVTSTSPSSRGQGATSQVISVIGTGFVTGAVASFSNAGITVNSTSFVDSSHLNVNITISGSAATGAGNATVTNPDAGVGTGTGVFAVNTGPTITSPSLASPENPGHNGTATFTMTGTNFASSVTVTGNGSATVDTFTWVNSTTITVKVTGGGGNGALGSFTVTNPDGGSFTSANGSFTNG